MTSPAASASLAMMSRIAWSLLAANLLAAHPLAGTLPAAAQPAASSAPPPPALERLKQHDQELEDLRAKQRSAVETTARLRREIAAIGDDRRKLSQQLIDTAARLRVVESRITATQERLAPLIASEQAQRRALDAQQDAIAEILAALQRIGRRPPPALLVRPGDALEALRSAMMLGAVLPDMRQKAEVLLSDLNDLLRTRAEIDRENAGLTTDLNALTDERMRLSLLTEERAKAQAATEAAVTDSRAAAEALARQAEDVRALIARLEQSLPRNDRRERAALRTDPERKGIDLGQDPAALRDAGRLAPAIAFAAAKGLLPLPVNGLRIRTFGDDDGVGGPALGLSIATRAEAQVTAPCDGWVVYSGPFRNYGQLLILNAGGGYHILLAGMSRISVELGQFVLTGEPVAVMGGSSQTANAAMIGAGQRQAGASAGQPVLYVEFRKDGTPVDPGPWWAAGQAEKVRG